MKTLKDMHAGTALLEKAQNSKGIREECGLIGVIYKSSRSSELDHFDYQGCGAREEIKDACQLAFEAMPSIQHRGQEAWGIIAQDAQNKFHHFKDQGLIPDHHKEISEQQNNFTLAIGHTRYSTTGASNAANIQPLETGGFALAHNGNIPKPQADKLKNYCIKNNAKFLTETDSEAILHSIILAPGSNALEKIKNGIKEIKGAFCLLIIHGNELYIARDPWGIRPLCIGETKDAWIIASETNSLDLLNAKFIRFVNPNEILKINSCEGISSHELTEENINQSFCMFEYIYLSHRKSISEANKKNIASLRECMGEQLAREYTLDADLVVPVPETGFDPALGYSRTTGITYCKALEKKRNLRSFMRPTQEDRIEVLKTKHMFIEELIAGKSIVLIDDSLVRGNTARVIIEKARSAGATHVHLLLSSPPVVSPCFYGVDFPSKMELIACSKNREEIAKAIGADSVYYLSIEGLKSVISNAKNCDACFTSKYPIKDLV